MKTIKNVLLKFFGAFFAGTLLLASAIPALAATAPSVAPANGAKSVYELFEKKTFTSGGVTLPYRIFVPDDYDAAKEYPLLMFFHGAGERGADNDSQLFHVLQECFNQKDGEVYKAIVVAPQCPAGSQWVDTPWANGNYSVDAVPESKTMKAVLALMDELEKDYSLDSNRTYLMGISMGGFAVWDIIARHPEIAVAAVPVCGGGDVTKTDSFTQCAIWTFHGSVDDTVPVEGTRALANAIEVAGSKNFKYTEVEGVGHGVWYNAAADDSVIPWLFSFTKAVPEESSEEPSQEPSQQPSADTASDVSPAESSVDTEERQTRTAEILLWILVPLCIAAIIGIAILIVKNKR